MKGMRTLIIIEVQIILILLLFLVWKTFDLEEKVMRTNMFLNEVIRDTRFDEILSPQEMDVVLGDPGAAGTIIMYSKAGCEYCTGFFEETFPLIDSAYVKTGKVKFIIRYLPENRDSASVKIMHYSYCMASQGILYQFQQQLMKDRVAHPEPSYVRDFALAHEKDTAVLSDCLHSPQLASYLTTSAAKARQAGVNVTPFFIINGKEIRGDRKFNKFKELIEQG